MIAALYIAAVWFTTATVLGLLVGPFLRRNRERQPSSRRTR